MKQFRFLFYRSEERKKKGLCTVGGCSGVTDLVRALETTCNDSEVEMNKKDKWQPQMERIVLEHNKKEGLIKLK